MSGYEKLKNHLIFKHFDQATTEETKSPYELQCLQLAEISVKNARAWVSMASYLKKSIKVKILEKKSCEPFRICLLCT